MTGPGAPQVPAAATPQQHQEVRELAERAKAGGGNGEPGTGLVLLTALDPFDQAKLDYLQQELDLRGSYATKLMWMLIAQIVAADGVFVAYAQAGVHWHIQNSVINAWLGAAVIQIVGVVMVVTRHLFPKRDTGNGK